MTDLQSLARAGIASTDDTVRLAYLDRFVEEHGETDWVNATRQFYAKCLEPRRYRDSEEPSEPGSRVLSVRRRALAGWREWLGQSDKWLSINTNADGSKGTWSVGAANWIRLVPSLWSRLAATDRWRRKGATVEVEVWACGSDRAAVVRTGRTRPALRLSRLTFARGWLARVEFRDWQSADALLPAILADQPFVEAGIRGQPRRTYGSGAEWELDEYSCGPVFREVILTTGWTKRGFRWSDRKIPAAALSKALRERAVAQSEGTR